MQRSMEVCCRRCMKSELSFKTPVNKYSTVGKMETLVFALHRLGSRVNRCVADPTNLAFSLLILVSE